MVAFFAMFVYQPENNFASSERSFIIKSTKRTQGEVSSKKIGDHKDSREAPGLQHSVGGP